MDDPIDTFHHTHLLSPPASHASPSISTTTGFATHTTLPTPRTHPLRPGSSKEAAFTRYVDATLLLIQRRWAKRNFDDKLAGAVKGFHGFREAARELSGVVEVVWVSGTMRLQIPYLLSIALLVTEMLPTFPAAPRAMFELLERLDLAFASLLQTSDQEQNDGNGAISLTEKIRMKSLVERTRVVVVDVMEARHRTTSNISRDAGEMNEEDEDSEVDDGGSPVAGGEEVGDGDGDLDMEDRWAEDEEDDWEMAIGRVYERTIQELGESVEGPPIGIITNG